MNRAARGEQSMKTTAKTPVQQTIDDGKRWWRLVQRYAKLEAADKLSSVVGALLLGAILLVLVLVVVVCLSLFAAHRLAALTGDMATGYALVGAGWLVIVVLLILLRNVLIIRPLQKKFQKSYFKDEPLKHSLELEKFKTQYQLQMLQERMKERAQQTFSGSSEDEGGSKIGQYISYGVTAYKTYKTVKKIKKMFNKKKGRR